MNRLWGLLLAAVMGTAMLAVIPQQASAQHSNFANDYRFARERTKFGAEDESPREIDHVIELQMRLKRLGLWRWRAHGEYGTRVRGNVKTFQRRNNLNVTGNASRATWQKLIRKTNKRLGLAKRKCDGRGWHICYDRTYHDLMLFRNGKFFNAWMVRGGSSSHKTRRGNFTVYYRDKDHVSSIYGSPMPYSQFFSGGQAFHGSTLMMHPWSGHSHGCVNMYIEDARTLWNLTHNRRLRVHIYGKWD